MVLVSQSRSQYDEINSRSNLNNARRDNIRAQAENSQKALQNQHHMSNRDEIYIELGPDEVPKSAKRSQNSGPGGRHIKSTLGDIVIPSDVPSKQQLEDQIGEIFSEIVSTLNTLSAYGRGKKFNDTARKYAPVYSYDVWRNKMKRQAGPQSYSAYQKYRKKAANNQKWLKNRLIHRYLQRSNTK